MHAIIYLSSGIPTSFYNYGFACNAPLKNPSQKVPIFIDSATNSIVSKKITPSY